MTDKYQPFCSPGLSTEAQKGGGGRSTVGPQLLRTETDGFQTSPRRYIVEYGASFYPDVTIW